MTAGVRVVCRPEVAPGFSQIGMPVHPLQADPDLPAALTALLGRHEAGVLLIEDTLYRRLPEDARRRVDRSITPVVVPFPSPAWEPEAPAEQYVVELLRRAIGYRVRVG